VKYDLGKGLIFAKVTVDEDFATVIRRGIDITPGQANAACDEYFNIPVDEPRYEEPYVPEEDDMQLDSADC
jgi:hypothetical protein